LKRWEEKKEEKGKKRQNDKVIKNHSKSFNSWLNQVERIKREWKGRKNIKGLKNDWIMKQNEEKQR
jgi:hypothetical protein